MFTLLDITEVAKDIAESPEKSTLGMLITLATAIAGIISGAKYFAERARKKSAAIVEAEPGTGKAPPSETAVAEMRQLLDEARRESTEVRSLAARWRLEDAEQKLAQLLPELGATKTALVEARAVNAELVRALEAQRLLNAQLQLALDHEGDVIDVVPVEDPEQEPWGEKTPTKPPRGLPPLRRLP